MAHLNYVHHDIWFAWRPVKTEEGNWAWLKYVARTIDERPLVYLGLLEEYKYYNLDI